MRKLNITKIKDNPVIISSEDALKDIIPINWSEEILTGKKKIIVTGVDTVKK